MDAGREHTETVDMDAWMLEGSIYRDNRQGYWKGAYRDKDNIEESIQKQSTRITRTKV